MKYHLLTAAALLGLSAPAYAQDVSGFRIEGRVGWDQASADASFPNPDYDEDDEDSEEFLTWSDDHSSVAFGAEIGYDVQIGSSFVLGAYAGAEFSDSEICGELIEDDLTCAGIERTFTLGARAGVPLGQSSLVYVKGGYSNGKFDVTYDDDVTDNDDDDAGDILSWSETLDGYHVGGGLELGLTRRLYAKLEYVYTNFGNQAYLPEDADADDPALRIGSDRHQVFAGVGLRF